MKLIDLSGQKYGQLTVLHLTGDVRSKSRCWLCQCTCGNTKVATTNELRSGGIKSCGCKKSNLTGKRYGKLTVQKQADNNTWLCQCDCGKRITVRHDDLTRSRVRSCGHKKDYTGNRYGHLTVIKWIKDDIWLCRCDCGAELTVPITNLIHKKIKSCGNSGHILPTETDYTGVTINGYIGVSKVNTGRWLWKCSFCGKISEIIVSEIKNGMKCACQIPTDDAHDYTGKKFANLTGVRMVGKNRWLWQCDCGALNVYKADDVISGKKKSCFGKRMHPCGLREEQDSLSSNDEEEK